MELQELDAHRHTVSTPSGDLSYLDIGTGPVALFVHGIGTNAYLWRNVIAGLTGQRRCIAVDLPRTAIARPRPTCRSPGWRRRWPGSATRSGWTASTWWPTTPAARSLRSSRPATRNGWPR